MLVLSRKKEESFVINDNIIVKIIDVGGERVKVGITAPRSVKIIRSELQQTIELNKESSESIDTNSLFTEFAKKVPTANNQTNL
jgi:carbon storage regulator